MFTTSSIEWPDHTWFDLSRKISQHREGFEAPEPENQGLVIDQYNQYLKSKREIWLFPIRCWKGPRQVDGHSTCPIYQKGQLNHTRLQTDRINARVGLVGRLNVLNSVFVQLICGSLPCRGCDFCRSRSAQSI